MKTIAAVILIIIIAAVCFVTLNAMAKETPFQAGYDHGCSDAKLKLSATYFNQPGKGPSFHTREFMSAYNVGFSTCGHESSLPVASSSLFKQGYAKGVLDAMSQQSTFPASTTMRPDEVDCDSDIDPQASNEDYCSGYQHGFADTNNALLNK